MTWQAWTTLAVLAGTFGTLALTRIGADLVMLAALTVLLTAGVLTPQEALTGFSNEAVVTIAALFVVAAGLRETRAISLLAGRVLGRPRSVTVAQLRLMVPVSAASAFMNNTPLVAILLPVVKEWAKRANLAVSKLLIPLSYASILGGLCTLIGTSTNLVVNGLVISQTGRPGLALFDISWLGVPCAVVGIAYVATVGRWLLPDRRPAISDTDDPRQYTAEMVVEPGSLLAGKTIEQAELRHLPGLFLVEIERQGEVLPAVAPTERLQAGDRLVFAGIVDSVIDLQKIRGLRPATDQVYKLDSPRSHRCLIEAVVSDSCPLVGKTIREGRFRTVYNAAVIAVARNGERLRCKIGDVVLQTGDTLLLEAHPWFAEQQRNSRDFFLVSPVEGSTPPRHERAWLALGILAAMVLVGGLGWLSVLNAALLAAGLMVLTGCCSGSDARRSLDWQVLLVIAASLGLGLAVHKSGAAAAIAPAVIGLAGNSPWLALVLVYGVTMLFTEVLSNTASAVLVFPIALATANGLGVSFTPYVMAIMIAASCGFATPIGYQTHLMVYGPGGYHFSDFVRVGVPLNLLLWVVTVAIAPLAWPF
ncbi:MAG: SLC13 family permease [Gemmataceae bacterium]|nr:SLC13 family permease [Gemmataceae bacterium]